MAENTQWLSVNPKIILYMVSTNTWNSKTMNDKGNCKNIIYLNHHLIKNCQILVIEKLIPKELYSYLFFWKMNFLRPKNIFATFSPIYKLNGRRFIFCHVKFQMTPIYVCSNIKYWTIFYIWINSFLFLTKKILNCVLTVNYKMKQLITFLLNVNLLSNYGVIWDIIVNNVSNE